ncbi:hypothetical protein D3C86_1977910 [compost metagenome]
MNSRAYLIARSLFRYWSTGSMKLTPKLRLLNSSQLSRTTQVLSASSRLVEKNEVCQLALKPSALIARCAGR